MKEGQTRRREVWGRWVAVLIYALAMAWVEAAVVLYLRTLTGHLDPYQAHPLPNFDHLAGPEVIREAATLVMLATVGWLAGPTRRSRLGFGVFAFGVWDIAYYVFLVPLTGWPHSLLDWDVLFLIPLPWWGPVLAPVLIASLMILGGSLLALNDTRQRPLWPARWAMVAGTAGSLLALYVFMADALRVVGDGAEALRNLLPTHFRWGLFLVALLGLAAPVLDLVRQLSQSRRGLTVSRPDSLPACPEGPT